MNSLPFSTHTLASPCSGPEREDDKAGLLEVTCKECKRSIVVTTHAFTTNFSTPAFRFSMKYSMHTPKCSLRGVPSKQSTMAKLPLLGNTVEVNKGAFTAKSI
jgi:hypothetical protein